MRDDGRGGAGGHGARPARLDAGGVRRLGDRADARRAPLDDVAPDWGPWPPAASWNATRQPAGTGWDPARGPRRDRGGARLPVVSQARPELEQLAAATSETANLAILDRLHVVYVDQVTPAQTVVMASWVGRRSPVHASSSGKVLVAFGTRSCARRSCAGGSNRSPSARSGRSRCAPTPPARGRPSGVRISSGELEVGLVTVAAPVMADGRAIAAVSVAGPSYRFPARDIPRLARTVMETALAIGHRMAGANQLVKADPIRGSRPTCGRSGRHRRHRL